MQSPGMGISNRATDWAPSPEAERRTTLIKWNSVSIKGLMFQEPFGAVSSIVLMNQGAQSKSKSKSKTSFRRSRLYLTVPKGHDFHC